MMLTEDLIKEKLADLQKEYLNFLLENVSGWQGFEEALQRMADGEEVTVDEIPKFFRQEYEWTRLALEMGDQAQEGFNWSDPRVSKLFAESAQLPIYKLWAEIITEISLQLADLAGVKTFLEIGAGKANLTDIMLKKLAERNTGIKLITTDSQSVILESVEKLKNDYPQVNQETLLWDIGVPVPEELLKKIESPVLMYERATLTYANYKSIENLAGAADILVLGDYFRYTDKLFTWDTIFDKIGVKPLFYKDVKSILDGCFPNQYILDQRVVDEIGIPYVTIVIAWK